MRCGYCGFEIPEGMLYCEQCGKELYIVPEYNPLDDMLTAQIKVAINDRNEEGADRAGDTNLPSNTGRNTGRKTGRSTSRNTGRNTSKNTSGKGMSEQGQRRKKQERKRALKKRRQRFLLVMALLIFVFIAGGVGLYQTSYAGIVNRGYKAEQKKDYERAESYFNKAIVKNEKKAEAYTGLAKVYVAQNELTQAEELFLNSIDKQPDNEGIYKACIQFYMDTDQKMEIPGLLEDAKDSVRTALAGYIVKGPAFSLDDEKVYDDVTQLTLTAKAGAVFYTTDGTDPTTKSTKYSEPIQLQEGPNEIRAIAVNKNGVPSLSVKKTFVVEFPIEDAPAVSPSTGQYDTPTKIEIIVPEGYTAYYTTDKSDPTTASNPYTGAIDMPEGETIFKAILVNAKGKESGITTRNYLFEQ